MAEIRNEKSETGSNNSDAASCGCRDSESVSRRSNNSIRGAALSLCMTVDELMELLEKREGRETYRQGHGADVVKLLERIAELESLNKALKEENAKISEDLKAVRELIIVAW